MGWFDALLGRSKPAKPDLDALFALPAAAVTLEAATGFTPVGIGSVSFRAAEGGAFSRLEQEVQALLGRSEMTRDSYGYTWIVVRHADVSALVTDLHAVNSSLESAGFGPSLLCSLVTFADPSGRRLAIVYLYKRGTFYPFAPAGGTRRDNALELQVRGVLTDELKIEPDLASWFPVWEAPGL
ncbi:PspA-associated protein PspAB [Sphaerimonospora mesophila]|uniref:PspA-associated protein PspAB n=1 Tax=Sphaerimonospora mesophila TaxID=37483 RepID=UPI0006E38944